MNFQFIHSQSTFFKTFISSDFERAFDAVETVQGDFIIIGEKATDYSYYDVRGFVLKIDGEGTMMSEISLMQNTNQVFLNIIKQIPGISNQFLIVGSSDSISDSVYFNKLLFYLINSNLDIQATKQYSSSPNKVHRPWKGEIAYDSLLYILSELYHINQSHNISVIKAKLPFDSITGIEFEDGSQIAADLMYLYETDVINVFYYGPLLDNSSLVKILKLDTGLNYIDCTPFPAFVITTASATYFNDSIYFFTATTDSINVKQHIAVFKMNQSDSILKRTSYFQSPDTILYAGGGTNTAISGQSLFITGVYNMNPSQFPWQTSPTWIQITRTDLDLNIISNHFYGGNCEYFPYSIISTSEGGAFITGFQWDYNIPGNEQWDIFALKVDTAGLVTNIPEDATWQMNDAILCPNPGSEYCIAVVGAQHPEATLFLHDMNGRVIMEQELHQPQTRINTASLPPGTYIYKFIAKGKVIGTGKWVKQ
ncbi:MAG: T9SS type A sorting domain-containing protein [Bacteroidales bacterium]|nr:T9SS type A sorting domain-containing protein [Bacteroidales bacterium]